ncbi:hypothetical protein ACFOVU_12695 [Nocardiopsis sediminis]|uniref:Uncharacterized protein n=1 Tax=Nocardiopsis sediminis TaxID=1778267 RepID=A0ABV8FQ79_9ACTN
MSARRAAGAKRLRPFRRREALIRALYTIEHPGPDGGLVTYTVQIDARRDDGHAELYADGVQQATADMPASFPVAGGVIEVDLALSGVRRVHLVLDGGREQRLAPVAGTLEDMRGGLHRRHPRLSRAIGWLAIAILVVDLTLTAPQALQMITEIPKIADSVGSFTSPIALPAWLNISLTLAAAAAAVERVLTLRSNRVLDIETFWTSL